MKNGCQVVDMSKELHRLCCGVVGVPVDDRVQLWWYVVRSVRRVHRNDTAGTLALVIVYLAQCWRHLSTLLAKYWQCVDSAVLLLI